MKINVDAPSDEIRIEIIPLIDIIFCILTFFIVVALQVTRQQAINVDLPTAKNSASSQMRDSLIVTVPEQGDAYIEQQQIDSEEQFTKALKNYRATNPNGAIVLRASSKVSYERVIQFLDLMKKVGGDHVALATEPIGASGPAPSSSTTAPLTPGVPGGRSYPGSNAPLEPYNSGTTYPPLTPYNPSQPPLPVNPEPPATYPITPGSTVPPYPTSPNSGTTKAPKKGGSSLKR